MQRITKTLSGMLTLAIILLISTVSFFSQSSLGSLAGTVTDANGAVVKGATVKVTNDASGEKREAVTNDSGTYVIPNLPVGQYTVIVTASGFSEATIKEAKVTVAFTNEMDITLSPSGVAASVTVSSSDSGIAVNTTDQQLSTLLNNKKILE